MQEDYKTKLGDEGADTLRLIKDKVGRIYRLVTDVLKYSQLTDKSFNSEPIQLNDLIGQLLKTLENDKARLKLVDRLPEVKTDRSRMKQLFQILLTNAIHHIDKSDGLVEVGYKKNGNYLQFYVRDNGVGMSEALCKKVFSIYESQNKVGTKTGLGLTIAKKIVRQLQGKIWVESEVGIGTIFFIELPCQGPYFKWLPDKA
jgi:signal transduction histidine kinase